MNKPEKSNTHEPFLKQIAQHYRNLGKDVENYCFVFPNRRSGQFFLKHYEEAAADLCLAPHVTTISDFVTENSSNSLATPIELIFNLYKAYCQVSGNDSYNFDQFIHWGNILVADFNDVDQYLVDAKQLFTNIKDWKEISADYLDEKLKEELTRYFNIDFGPSDPDKLWRTPNGEVQAEVQDKYKRLWEIMYSLYTKYNELLEEKQLSYPGKMLREYADAVKDMAVEDFAYEKYVFVGFNLLTTSEMMIFDALKNKNIAIFHWDDASPALANEANKGHKHLAFLSNRYKAPFDLQEITKFPQNINVVGLPSNVAQTKYAFTLVNTLKKEGEIKAQNKGLDTAIVLPDENLFTNITNSVPADIDNINATLGIPLRNSDLASLMRNIAKMHKNAYRPGGEDYFGFYREFVKEVLSHPIIKSLYPDATIEISNKINNTTDFYISEEYLCTTALRNIFTTIKDNKDVAEVGAFIDRLIALCTTIATIKESEKKSESDENDGPQASLQNYFAQLYLEILHETKALINEYGIPMVESSVLYIFDRLASLYTVPFEGEPLSGLQVMGMLETRNLDFDNLIILSMNERVFPRKFYKSSFIPPNMRRYFLMSTVDEQEAMSAYYFFRLISRAKNVYLLYDTSTTGVGSSEYSRFISQLEMVYGCTIKFKNISMPVKPETSVPITVEKTDEIYEKILKFQSTDDKVKKNLSASSIKKLLKCPLWFYFHYIEGLDDDNNEEQFMDAATFGTIVHDTLESLYYPADKKGKGGTNVVKVQDIKNFKEKELEKELIRQVNKVYLRKDNINDALVGETAITLEALKHYCNQVLDYDIEKGGKEGYYTVYECEKDRTVRLTMGKNEFNFTYKIDRLDRMNDESAFRIIDYKTGKDNVLFKNVDAILSNKESGRFQAIMQLLLYCHAFETQESEKAKCGLKPMIYKIKEMDKSGITYDKNEGRGTKSELKFPLNDYLSHDFDDLRQEFTQKLGDKLDELFDKDVPFTQCEENNDAPCKYCKFKEFCRR
ncbi:MAG: PD-(D/E)XK nuclease family protein [Bacteroidales bacterium]|nr:PD-(D/E)XK nuclease family protein [Bacteroidales bacterium]